MIKTEDSPHCQNVAFRFPFAEELFKRFLYKAGGGGDLKELDYRDVYMAMVWRIV